MKKKIIAFLLFNITFLFGSNVVFAATNSTILRKNPYQKVNYKNTWTATDQGDWEANAYYTDNKSSSHITGSKGSNAYCIFPSGKSGVGNGKSVTATEVTNNSSFHKIVKLLYYGYGGPKWNKSGDTLSQRIKGYYDAVCSAYRTDASGRHYAFENGVCDDDDYYFITHIALSYFASKLPDSSYRVPDETDVFYILNWVTEDQIKSSSLTQDPYNTITISDSDFHVWYYEQGSGYQNFVYWTYGDEPTPPSTGTLKVQKNFSGGSSSDSAQDLSTNTYAFYLFDSTCTTKVKERQFTDSSGIATFTNLELNKNYCLVEATDNFDGTQAALPSVTDPGESIYCRRNDTDDCYIARAYEPDVFRKPVQFTTSGQTVNYTNKKEATYCASVTKLGVNGLTFGSATFGVYSNSSCSGSPTETFTLSSSSPTKTWSGLSSSTSKYIKETSAPSGFVLDNTCHEITAKSSCTPDFVTNYPYYLTFAKTDENGNAMANAKFKVKNSSGTVIKVSAKSNQYNGCYLYDTSGTIEEMETDSTGRICIIKIPSGTYSAEETATGNSSYPLPSSTSDRTLTGITTSTSVQTFANAKKFKNTPYLINFYKVDEENNPKGGATFKIKNSSGQYITHSGTSSTGGYRGCYIYSGTNSTGSNFVSATSSSNLDVNVGEVCVIKVPSGTYSAEETSISDTAYYVDQNNKTITGITAGTSKSSFANAKKLKNYPYYLSFYKKDEDGNFMEGAEFKLKVGSTLSNTYVTTSGTDSKGCYIYSGTGDTGSKFTTDSNGRVCISRVSIQNSYYTYEVSTGNTSYAVVTTSKTISRSTSILDSTTNNTVINKPYLINFYKVNEENNSMSGSTFKIKTSGNKYLKYKKSNNNPVYSSTSGYIGCYIYDGEDNTGDIFTTSSSSNNNGVSIGEICVIRVKNETYSAIEQSSGSNQYYLDPNNNTITGITATTSLTAKENAKKLTNYPYIIQMWKSKEDKSNYLSEASFRVYYLDGTTKHYLNSNGVSDVTGYKGCYKYSGETTVENNSSAFITSRVASGNISADEICIIGIPNVTDRKYYAFEYQSNDVKYSTQAKSLGSNTDLEMAGPNSTKQVKSDNYTFLNTPYLINFFKTDENGNNGANDPGFSSNFKVYDNNNKYVIVETNVNNEPIKSNVNEYKGCYIYKSSTTNASSASVLTSNSLENLPIRKGEICIIRIPQKNSYEDNDTLTYTAIEVESNNSSYFVPTNNRIVGLTPSTVFNDKTSNNSIKNRPYLLNFFKVNEDGEANEVLLNGAEFSIRNSNGTTIGYKGTESYTDEDNHTKTCYIYSTANDATYTFISGENGNAGEVCLVRVPKTNNGEELSYTITETDPAKYHTFGNYKTITLKTTKNFQSKLPLSSTDKNKFINYPTEFEFTKNVGRTKGKGINVEGSETITVNGEIVTLDSLTLSELKNLVFNITVSGSTTNLSFIKTGDGVYEYAQDPNMDRPNGEITTNLKVGSNKKIKVLHLPEGTYEIKENNGGTCESATDYTKCIGYYDQNTVQRFTITDCSSPNATSCTSSGTVTASMTNIPTEITFTKSDLYSYVDEGDTVKFENEEELRAFDDIVFKLFTYDENNNKVYLTLKHIGNSGVCTSENSYSIYRYVAGDNSDGAGGTELHTCGGHIVITNLCRGKKYYIEEVSVPGYSVFTLPENESDRIKEYTIPCTEGEAEQSTTTTAIINDTPTRVIFQKRDSKYGYLIPDETTTFKVYRCKKNTECHPSENDSNAVLVKFSARGTITGDNEDSGKQVYKFLTTTDEQGGQSGVTELHPYRGELILRYLPGGFTYVLLETVPPKNYTLPRGRNAETRFTVSTSTVDVDEVDVPNKPTSLLLKKYSDDGELLEGAEFEIYEGTTCDPNLSPMAQPKELLSFKTITDGIYEYRRNFDTSRIRTCTDTVDGKCSGMTSTLTFENYVDTWANFENSVNQREEEVEIKAGEALIQYLEYGHCYIIKEVKAPKGYSLPEKEADRYIMVTIEKEDDVVDTYKELINKPTPYTFYKFDEYNELIDGAEFKLQKLNSDKVYEDVTVSLYETEVDRSNKGNYYKVDSETDNTLITTVNGAATIFFLEEGQYRIVETKAPEGKELPAKQMNVATFLVDKDGRVTGNSIITNKPKTEKIEVKPKAEAELIVNISTGQQVIRYGLIIGVIVISIFGLIMVQNKQKKDN